MYNEKQNGKDTKGNDMKNTKENKKYTTQNQKITSFTTPEARNTRRLLYTYEADYCTCIWLRRVIVVICCVVCGWKGEYFS